MSRRKPTSGRLWRALGAAPLAYITLTAQAQVQASAATAPPGLNLRAAYEAAWARQPEARALAERRDAAGAQRRAADAWTPGPPALELSHKTDRFNRREGAREDEIGLAVPLWLPGERGRSAELADAEAAAVESRARAVQLAVAAEVREAWWAWQRSRIEAEVAGDQLGSARRLAEDVSRRLRAGELARADQHQADGAVAAAESAVAQAAAGAMGAAQQLQSLTGLPVAQATPPLPDGAAQAEAEAEAEASEPAPETHPALGGLQDLVTVADRRSALATRQSRANPELLLAVTRDRGVAGDPYGRTVTVAISIPFGGGALHDSRVAAARADAAEAQAQLALERERLAAVRESSRVRVDAARVQMQAAERRAQLARESRDFFDKSFRLGETDLPTRLRIEAEAVEAERQAAGSRLELAAAISARRQALGLLPQ